MTDVATVSKSVLAREVNREKRPLTRLLAQKMLEMKQFAPDRKVNAFRVSIILDAMKKGTFVAGDVTLKSCIFDGEEYRMNGQHVATARLQLEDDGYHPMVNVVRCLADTEDEMRQLYASTDSGYGRTKGTKLHARLFEHSSFDGFSKSLIRKLAEGYSFWRWSTKSGEHTGDAIADDLLSDRYHALTKKVGRFLMKHTDRASKHVNRAATIAAMYETFFVAPMSAVTFWEEVATGANLLPECPQLRLRNKLMTVSVRSSAVGKSAAVPDDMYGWCIQAWNAIRGDTDLTFRSTAGKDRPVAI